jgi:hypothetical protein
VGLIVKHLAKGGTVYTNVDLVWEKIAFTIRKRYRRIPERDQLRRLDLVDSAEWHKIIEWGTPELPVLVVLDEIHLFFNARDWAKTAALHRDMLSFLSQSRKACVDVVFIAQVATTLEKQFRVQCEWEFYCRNVKDIQVPIFGTLPLNRMLLVQRDMETDKPMRRQLLAYDRGLWPCYDTRSMLDAQMREAAAGTTRQPPRKLKRTPILSMAAAWSFLLSGLGVGTWWAYHSIF